MQSAESHPQILAQIIIIKKDTLYLISGNDF